ncbi:DJ-1/PfpI family protein [Sphaerisporangium perillae]|uniref:DJ-1/PfpI family protein n=1 Tax=Sphaerisporangium perillae TaxID=2935860 RepID=UPI00200EA8D5|nr:DJ-1/PfpI family protein [Sphaerisporangium perillae]
MTDVGSARAAQPRPQVAMLLYPGLTLLDLFAPHTALARTMDVHLVWKTMDPVVSDTGVAVLPTATLADCPAELDVLFVPGGLAQDEVAADEEVLAFLEDRGARAKYVTSVCGGSLILGAAGLLRGYRAATHWTGRDVLALFGAENVSERVVVDRNRITGGGVTAGLDFGLVVLAELLGEDVARFTQLIMEYDPRPPFTAGSPEGAGPELTAQARVFSGALNASMTAIAEDLATRGWGRARQTTPA